MTELMQSTSKIRVLSLGAGVQSSALLLMADRGDIEPVDFAVFADVQAEPKSVYDWLDRLEAAVGVQVIRATRGNIATDVIDHFEGRRRRVGQPPLYARATISRGPVVSEDEFGNSTRGVERLVEVNGMIRRHCTSEYKIEVVDRAIRDRLGYKPRQKMRHAVEVVMGISFDEMQRMKVPQEKWKTFSYPLIDKEMRRSDCIAYVETAGLGTPPRSACFFCPFKTNAEWRRLRDTEPDEWAKAVEFDRRIRTSKQPGLTSQFFVHRDRVPLEEVDLSDPLEAQFSFLDECEGMCGV